MHICMYVCIYVCMYGSCLFTDKQLVRLQETPDEIPEGETPHTVSIFAYDDLVDSLRPGTLCVCMYTLMSGGPIGYWFVCMYVCM